MHLLLIACLMLVLASKKAVLFSPSITLNCTLPNRYRDDCGHFGIQKEECVGKGCCWVPCTEGRGPWCFHPRDIRSPHWTLEYVSTNNNAHDNGNFREDGGLEYEDGVVRVRATWREYANQVARLTIKDAADAQENLLWEEFYEKREEKMGSSVLGIEYSKERPSFKVMLEEERLFELDDLVWKPHFIAFQISLQPNSTVNEGSI